MKHLLLFLLPVVSFSQSEFGLAASYQISSNFNGSGFIKDKYQIFNSQDNYDGFRINAFAKVVRKIGYWWFETGYFQSSTTFFIINLKPQEEDASLAPVWNVNSADPNFRRFDLGISRGVKLIRNFSGEIGVIAGYWLKDRLAGYGEDYFTTESLKRSKIIYRFSDSYVRLSASAQVKLIYNFGPLQVMLTHEQSITPLAKSVPFNGENYPLKQTYKNFAIGLGYTIYKSKNEKKD